MISRITPMKRSRMNRGPSKKQRAKQAQWRAASSGEKLCQLRIPGVCTTYAQGGQHVVKRRFNVNDASNRLESCNACNGWVEDHAAEALALGISQKGNGLPIQKFERIFGNSRPVQKGAM